MWPMQGLDGGTSSVGQKPQVHIMILPANSCMNWPSLAYFPLPETKRD